MLVFLSATATSSVLMNGMYYFDATKGMALSSGGKKHLESGTMGVPAVAGGAFLLGVGMSVAGACPGTSYAQLGGGAFGTLATIGGGVLGAFIFGWAYPSLVPFMQLYSIQNRGLPEMLGLPRWLLAAGFSGMLAAVITIILVFGYDPLPSQGSGILGEHWHPVLAGVIIGSI